MSWLGWQSPISSKTREGCILAVCSCIQSSLTFQEVPCFGSKGLIASLLTGLAVNIGSTNAQYVGPGATKGASNVGEILKNPVDDMIMEIYVLRGMEEIVVAIDNHLFSAQEVTETTTVGIHAAVDKDNFGKPGMDAMRVTVVTQ